MSTLPVHLEPSPALAAWLGAEELVLVREDLLPGGGGKKRRALEQFVRTLPEDVQHIHLLSYAGSHTAYTLARLLPDRTIHLYGTHYGGGRYEQTMSAQLAAHENIIQQVGSIWSMSRAFQRQQQPVETGHYFMKIGGSLGSDKDTRDAVKQVMQTIGNHFHHVVAVASGDLLTSIAGQTTRVTGVLTQPLAIRLIKFLKLPHVRGVVRSRLSSRIALMKTINDLTGNVWDPIFMGTVFSFLKQQNRVPPRLCLWVTCPGKIPWLSTPGREPAHSS